MPALTDTLAFPTLRTGEFFGELDRYASRSGDISFCGQVEAVDHHQHADAHIVFVPNGEYQTTACRASALVGPGSIIFNPPGTEHRDRYVGSDPFISFSLAEPVLRTWGREKSMPQKSTLIVDPRAVILMANIAKEARLADPVSELVIELASLELIALLAKAPAGGSLRRVAWLARCRERIEDDLSLVPSVQELAEDASVHPVYLARAFRRRYGHSPAEYLRHTRIARAGRLLRTSQMSLVQVSLACGFADQPSFTKAFGRLVGTTPGQFRAQYQGNRFGPDKTARSLDH